MSPVDDSCPVIVTSTVDSIFQKKKKMFYSLTDSNDQYVAMKAAIVQRLLDVSCHHSYLDGLQK